MTCKARRMTRLRCAGACRQLQRPQGRTRLGLRCCRIRARPDGRQIVLLPYCSDELMGRGGERGLGPGHPVAS